MTSRSFLLLPTLALVCATIFPSTSRAQSNREVATELDNPSYLFPLNDYYYLDAKVPEKAAPDVPTQIESISVRCVLTQKGLHEIHDVKLQCQGVTYTVPAHKVLVLDDEPKKPGLFIRSEPDPNGSGNVAVIINWYGDKEPQPDYIFPADFEKRTKGIEVLRANGTGGTGKVGYEYYLEMLLRNTTNAPYTLKPEFFKNVPPVEHWPEIVIPPAKDK